MRNSAENKPFRIARYCSCPTFLHSRERGKVATVPAVEAVAPRLPSPDRQGGQVAKTRNRWDGRTEKKRVRAGHRVSIRCPIPTRSFTVYVPRRSQPLFFSRFAGGVPPLPPQCDSAVSRKPDHRLPSQQESERSTGENQVLARNVP